MIQEEEVIKCYKSINTNTSSALENLSSKVLKIAFLLLSRQFTFILNLSLTSMKVPDTWKIASVTPLFKSGNASQCNNCRPISQFPLPGKILEKIVHQKISTFFEMHQILNPNQGGFRKIQSTTNTTAKFLMQYIIHSIRNKYH